MTTCLYCLVKPVKQHAKTCGDDECKRQSAAEARLITSKRKRREFYGADNPWVKWEEQYRDR